METNQEGEPPLSQVEDHFWSQYGNNFKVITLWWRRLCRNVHGDAKNLLDFQRPIQRCGPLSIF